MPTQMPAYIQLHRDVLINADLWTDQPQILAAGYGFEGITGIPGLTSAADLNRAALAGAGVNFDYAALDPVPTLRNLTSAGSPIGYAVAGFGATPVQADAMPIEFSWPLLPSSVSPTDIQILLNTGERVTPVAAALNPNYDYNERHVIVAFGEFGNRLAPGVEGAIYPVSIEIIDDGTPLQAVGPDGPVSIVGLTSTSSNPYVAGPSLVGARLTKMSTVGDFSPPALNNATPNDGVSLYGDDAQYRLRLFTSGGFSPDGVSGFLPTEFSRFFRLTATDANGATVTIDQTGVAYDLGVGTVEVVGLAELGAPADGDTVTYGPYYVEDHDNYFDVILKGDAAAVARLTQVQIPTSAEAGYSDIYNPGGPGRTPVDGVTYTEPAAAQTFPITVSLNSLGTVSYADQAVADYDQDDGLPVVFRLYNPDSGDHFYTSSSTEAVQALGGGYREEGVAFSNEGGSTALADIQRFYNPSSGNHFYTASVAERDALIADGAAGYVYEGVGFQAYATATEGADPIHRFYSEIDGDHLFTTSFQEGAGAARYRYEGVAWYADAFQSAADGVSAAAGKVEGTTLWTGSNRRDVIVGGDGQDTLTGGLGADTLTGGAGEDVFHFTSPLDGGDVITDFQSGQDVIMVTGADFDGLAAGRLSAEHFALDAPNEGDNQFVFDTRTGVLSFDADGKGLAAPITVATLGAGSLIARDLMIAA